MTANGSSDTVTLEIIRASEVTPREVKWLWYPYIPFGKITLLQGDPVSSPVIKCKKPPRKKCSFVAEEAKKR